MLSYCVMNSVQFDIEFVATVRICKVKLCTRAFKFYESHVYLINPGQNKIPIMNFPVIAAGFNMYSVL
jgi:hypothetical protein